MQGIHESGLNAADIIRRLDLKPHPEGGHYRETYRDESNPEKRGTLTAMYYLLQAGEVSHWHRFDAVEIWHWYAGHPLEMRIADNDRIVTTVHLGPNVNAQPYPEHPQVVVPAYAWQSAHPLGDWSLVGCTVSPSFQFQGFELAPPDWTPGSSTVKVTSS